MTKLLEEAFRKASVLPEEKQDHLAALLLEEMAREEHGVTRTDPESLTLLDGAIEALPSVRAGRIEPVDRDTL